MANSHKNVVAADAHAPAAHAASHLTGATDAIKIDDLAAGDDNTDLNASTTKHGLLLKLDNASTNFLNGQGAWAVPPGSGGALATDTLWDAAGDLVQGTGANTAAKLGAGTVGQFLKSGGAATANAWASRELDYVEFTAPVTVSASAEGATTLVVTSSSVTFDGSAVVLEFFAPYVQVAVTDNVIVTLYDDTAAASIGKLTQITNPDAANVLRVAVHAFRRFTPAAGARVYKITAFRVTADGAIGAGAGGAGNLMPGFIRISRAV